VRSGGVLRAVGFQFVATAAISAVFAFACSEGCATARPVDDGRIDFSKRTIQTRVRMHLATSVEAEPGMRAVEPESGPRLYLFEPPIVTERDIYSAVAMHGKSDSVVRVQVTSVAAARLQDATARNIGQWLAIMVDDQLLSAPQIQAAMVSDAFVLRGKFSKAKADQLANALLPR
jgi:preprotein translocase subunit SecD